MATSTQAPPERKRRQYYTGETFSSEDVIRLEFTSPGGKKEIFGARGPFLVTGMCMDQERIEDEFYYVVLTDHNHPGWTTEIPMDMIVQDRTILHKPKSRCFGRLLSFWGGK